MLIHINSVLPVAVDMLHWLVSDYSYYLALYRNIPGFYSSPGFALFLSFNVAQAGLELRAEITVYHSACSSQQSRCLALPVVKRTFHSLREAQIWPMLSCLTGSKNVNSLRACTVGFTLEQSHQSKHPQHPKPVLWFWSNLPEVTIHVSIWIWRYEFLLHIFLHIGKMSCSSTTL